MGRKHQVIERVIPSNGDKCFETSLFEGSKEECKAFIIDKKEEIANDTDYQNVSRVVTSLSWESKDGTCKGQIFIN